ncbi:MAG: hypothetical protein DWI00_13040 [Planctomycetota bacterium]|nr:MAG: hypothetical protein DWI00_13040 [Planctomycetota bacterium]
MCQIGSLRCKDSATLRTIVFLHELHFDPALARPQIRLETIARKMSKADCRRSTRTKSHDAKLGPCRADDAEFC